MATHTFPLLRNRAARYPILTGLIRICIELPLSAFGVLLGACLWDDLLSQEVNGIVLRLAFLGLFVLVCIVRYRASASGSGQNHPGSIKRLNSWALYFLHFLLYLTAGGLGAQRASEFNPSGGLYAKEVRVEEVYDITKPAQVLPARQERQSKARPARQASDRGGTRFGYFLLFLLGIGLALGAYVYAIIVAWAGMAASANVVFLLASAPLAGGFYFFGRAVDDKMKLYAEMIPEERKREGRRLLRTWLVTFLGLGLIVLLS
jgi:hypothetical protein